MSLSSIHNAWNKFLGTTGVLPWVVIGGVNLGLALGIGRGTLRNFPNSGDEYAMQLSARLFSQGRLSAPPLEPREFFTPYQVINDHRLYGKYPPGWPALLSGGMKLGVPWLVNPLLGLLTLIILHRTARDHYTIETANLSLFLVAGNPYFLFNSASYFSHPCCLFALTLFTFCSLRATGSPGRWSDFVGAGTAAGLALVTRPFTAAVVVSTIIGLLLLKAGKGSRRRMDWKKCFLGVGVFCLFGVALLAYNRALTGDPLLSPFAKYNPRDTLGENEGTNDWTWAVHNNLLLRLWSLNEWMPLSLVVCAAFLWKRECRDNPNTLILVGVPLSLLIGHLFYLRDPMNEYGPRYLYESTSALLLLSAVAIRSTGHAGPVLAAAILVINLTTLATKNARFSKEVEDRMAVFEAVEQRNLSNAIVLLNTGSGTMLPRDLLRNGTDLTGTVLYALDLGDNNAKLKKRYPERRYYLFTQLQPTGETRLVPEDTSPIGR